MVDALRGYAGTDRRRCRGRTGHRAAVLGIVPCGRSRPTAQWGVTGPVSDLAAFADAIKNDLTATPVRTTAEACNRIEALTGMRRGLTQTRTFLAGLGFQWQRTRAVPVPPKSR